MSTDTPNTVDDGSTLASRALREGLDLTAALENYAVSMGTDVVGLPAADVERFAPPAPATDGDSARGAWSVEVVRLVRFEVARANGLLDAEAMAFRELSMGRRLRLAWEIGRARSVLQALTRHPDVATHGRPRPWRVSQILAAFRGLRRAQLRHRARSVAR